MEQEAELQAVMISSGLPRPAGASRFSAGLALVQVASPAGSSQSQLVVFQR